MSNKTLNNILIWSGVGLGSIVLGLVISGLIILYKRSYYLSKESMEELKRSIAWDRERKNEEDKEKKEIIISMFSRDNTLSNSHYYNVSDQELPDNARRELEEGIFSVHKIHCGSILPKEFYIKNEEDINDVVNKIWS